MIKYTRQFQNRLEDLFAESQYNMRYEKGNFKCGYCIIKDKGVVIINKYYSLEGKVNCLVDIIRNLTLDLSRFSESNKKFYLELTQTQLVL